MKRIILMVMLAICLAAVGAGFSDGPLGAVQAYAQNDPGDGGLGCDASNVGTYASWGGHTYYCTYVGYVPYVGYNWVQIN